jgi:hypothetical protein
MWGVLTTGIDVHAAFLLTCSRRSRPSPPSGITTSCMKGCSVGGSAGCGVLTLSRDTDQSKSGLSVALQHSQLAWTTVLTLIVAWHVNQMLFVAPCKGRQFCGAAYCVHISQCSRSAPIRLAGTCPHRCFLTPAAPAVRWLPR